jgi:hypothetical protein
MKINAVCRITQARRLHQTCFPNCRWLLLDSNKKFIAISLICFVFTKKKAFEQTDSVNKFLITGIGKLSSAVLVNSLGDGNLLPQLGVYYKRNDEYYILFSLLCDTTFYKHP